MVQLNHVQIRADFTGPVSARIRIMHKPVANLNSPVQRGSDTESQSELKRATKVLMHEAMPAKQRQSNAHFDFDLPILPAESKRRNSRSDYRRFVHPSKDTCVC
ncbi:MAG: hypothetical protein FD173_128 [Gallionellaceae bacterium]|nr:MAG: hypothetical protein FD173_128 [Gallionellaceae bacterium]